MTLIGLLHGVAVIAAAWIFAYWRTPLWIWSLVVVVVLVVGTLLAQSVTGALWVGWILAVVILVPLNIRPLRRLLVSNRLLPLFRSALPPMSQTEREALEAGSVWWEGELFRGQPRWRQFFAMPAPGLSEEEQAFLDGPVQELCDMLDDWEITAERYDLPQRVWQFIKEHRFFAMIIPKEYGGLGFSAAAHSAVVMKIASRSTTAAVIVMVPNSLGPAELLLRYGTEDQRRHYLPRLAKGQEIPCFALTSPEAGSDAASITDRGVVCKEIFQGKETLGIKLNWEKRYITLGPVATVLGLAFRLYDPNRLIGEKEDLGITLALIPTDTAGIEIGDRHFPLNIPFQNGPNRGRDVFIPMNWVIGGVDHVGHGWRMLMECLAAGRAISLPSLSAGTAALVARVGGAFARIRRQFKQPIGRFEGVEEALARIAGNTYAIVAVRNMTAGAVDQGAEPAVASAIAKYHLTEKARQVINDGMDVLGGSGIMLGPRNLLGRCYQGTPIGITVEGANILTRSLIIFGQGAVRCHPYILEAMRAVKNRDAAEGRKQFDQALFGHIGYSISNFARALFLALSGGALVRLPELTPCNSYFRQLTRMSAAFALTADVAMLTLGGSLKRRERLSGRLADALSQLFIASAALKRFTDQGHPLEDLPLVRWVCEDALWQCQEALDGLLRNFPVRPVAWVLRGVLFPFGRPFRRPSDWLSHQAAQVIFSPGAARDRLTAGIYLTTDTAEQLGRIEDALQKVVAAEAVETKLRRAVRDGLLERDQEEVMLNAAVKQQIITKEEAEQVRAAHQARREAVAVDQFPQDYWQTRG